MNGWSSHVGADRWDDEPAWVYEITWEWEPLPGQRYPGDPGRRRAVHHPVYDASRAAEAAASWDADFRSIAQASGPPASVAPSSGGPTTARPVSPAAGRASVGRPPQPPPSWSGPEEQGHAPRTPYVAGSTPPPQQQGPSWNRPVPLPDRLPEPERHHPRPSAERPQSAPPLYGDPRSAQQSGRPAHHDPRSGQADPRSAQHDPRSGQHDPRSVQHDPRDPRAASQGARRPEQARVDPHSPGSRYPAGQQAADSRFAADARSPDGRAYDTRPTGARPEPEARRPEPRQPAAPQDARQQGAAGQPPRPAQRPDAPPARPGADSYVPYRLGPASLSPSRPPMDPASQYHDSQPARPISHDTPPYQGPASTAPVAPFPAPRPVAPDPTWAQPVDPRPATPLGPRAAQPEPRAVAPRSAPPATRRPTHSVEPPTDPRFPAPLSAVPFTDPQRPAGYAPPQVPSAPPAPPVPTAYSAPPVQAPPPVQAVPPTQPAQYRPVPPAPPYEPHLRQAPAPPPAPAPTPVVVEAETTGPIPPAQAPTPAEAETTGPIPPVQATAPAEAEPAAEEQAIEQPAVEEQPVEEQAVADEPHGLGWLLSQSGLGAIAQEPATATPDPVVDAAEPTPDAPVSGAPADNAPVSAAPVSAAPVSAAPVSAAPVSAVPVSAVPVSAVPVSAVPVSGAAEKQDWFSPTTETRMVRPRTAEASPPEVEDEPTAADEVIATDETGDVIPATVLEAAEPVETEPQAEPIEAGLVEAEVVEAEAEPVEAELVEPEPIEPAPTAQADTGIIDAEIVEADPEPNVAEEAEPEPTEEATPEPDNNPEEEAAEEEQPVPRTGIAALRTPSTLLPILNVPAPPPPERRRAEPEQVLAAYPWKVDPGTLRETAGDPEPLLAMRDRLTDNLEYAERDHIRARLLSLRAVISRVLDEPDRALADAQEALRHAEATGERRRTAIVQARLAHVHQWRGDFAEADRLLEDAGSVELPDRLRGEMHVQAGRSCFEQGRYLEACNHFESALELRRVEDPGLVARTEFALDAVLERVREAGDWGPYPRSREEILQQSQPPHPALDYDSGWQGYADSDGVVVIPEQYAETQPFHEGVAWVRRPGTAAWELIDETGTLVIDAASGYVQASRFADGLAWVSREPAGGWFAVDWHNRVIVPGGFEEVRPYRHGLALVRRGGWGAVDQHGRVVVRLKYQRFATELTAGGPVEGFTGDGLAVIDAGDRLGVMDRTGQLLVAPVHHRLLIHPVAFIIGDRDGHWGALDRHGDPVVEVTRARPADVIDEIEGLLADTRPIL